MTPILRKFASIFLSLIVSAFLAVSLFASQPVTTTHAAAAFQNVMCVTAKKGVTNASATVSCPVSQSAPVGSLVVVYINSSHDLNETGAGGGVVSDSKGNTYHTIQNCGTVANMCLTQSYSLIGTALNVSALDNIKFSFTNASGHSLSYAWSNISYSGMPNPVVVDTCTISSDIAGSSTGTNAASGSCTTTNPNDLLSAGIAVSGPSGDTFTVGGDGHAGTFIQPTGSAVGTSTGSGTDYSLHQEYEFVSSANSYSAHATLGTSRPWLAAFIAFQTDVPPTPTPTPSSTPIPPTATPTNTTVPATATPTNTTVPATATPTNTSVPPTATPTNTGVPTATPTPFCNKHSDSNPNCHP